MRGLVRRLRWSLQLRPLSTLLAMIRLRSGAPRILVFRGVFCNVRPGAALRGAGSLHLGVRWEGSRYRPSEFKLMPGSCLSLEGRFEIFTGCSISVNSGATLVLGSGYINHRGEIDCFQEIRIGHDVAISSGVTIRDSDNHSIDVNEDTSAAVHIGDHVWIGLNSTILKGVTIGEGAVVAAGSVVIESVPPHTLVGGVPARILRRGVTWK